MADPKPLPTDGPNLAQNVASAVKDTHWSGKEGVWDGIKKVVTGKSAYETDGVEKAFKLLEPKSIDKNTAMPGATNPTFLTNSQLGEMNRTTVIPTVDGAVVTNNLPSTSMTKYHDVNTTYLNADKKDKGGC